MFAVQEIPELRPRYNIAPTQGVPTVRLDRDRQNREMAILTWGLVPRWAKDPGIGNKLINARAETVAEKPAFRTALKYKRCLIPSDGFYEWYQLAGRKQPVYIRKEDHSPFAYAGLWEYWASEDGSEIQSCTIITTEANEFMSKYHGRMPVILSPEDHELWLDTSVQESAAVARLLKPYEGGDLIAYPVPTYVNSPRNDDPQCVEPLVDDEEAPGDVDGGPGLAL